MENQQAPTRRRKCIDIKYHYLQDTTGNYAISIHRVSPHDMSADMMTKPLKKDALKRHCKLLNFTFPPPKEVTFNHETTQYARQGDCDSTQKEIQMGALLSSLTAKAAIPHQHPNKA